MAERSAAQLVDIRLVEFKRIEDSYFQDYAKVHERLERALDKEPRPLSPEAANLAADILVAWLAGQAAKSVPPDRISQFLRVGLGHICAEIAWGPHLPLEEIAARAYVELQRRGWDQAIFDPEDAEAATKRVEAMEAARAAARPKAANKKPSSAGSADVKKKVSIGNPKVAAAKAPSKAAPAKKEALMALEKKSSPAAKPAAAKKAASAKPAAKKPAAKAAAKKAPAKPGKKVAAKKPAVKKVAEKKVAAKKPAAKKAVAKKPVAKKAVAKKPVAKKAVAKKPVAKKAVAKKPAVKKAAVAKKPAVKKAAVAKKPAAKKAPAAKKPAAKKPAAKKPAAPRKAAAPKPAEVKAVPASPAEEKKPESM